jgi:hypothetical protein
MQTRWATRLSSNTSWKGWAGRLFERNENRASSFAFASWPGLVMQTVVYCLLMVLPLMSTLSRTTMLEPVSGPPSIIR